MIRGKGVGSAKVMSNGRGGLNFLGKEAEVEAYLLKTHDRLSCAEHVLGFGN